MKAPFKFLISRLSEPSTYKGIVLAITGLGLYISPELAAAITSLGLGITGLIGIFTADPAPVAATE